MCKAVYGWWRSGELVAVQATVDKLELHEHHGDSTTWQAEAEFSYQYNGKSYRSKRINIAGDSSDNLSDYHQQIHRALMQARSSQQSVTVWMDPQEPAYAVYDRQVRLNRLMFLIPFATLFPLVGIGGFAALWFIWWPQKKEDVDAMLRQQTNAEGWLEFKPTSGAGIALGGFALVWNLLCFPMAYVVLTDNSSKGLPLTLLILLFPAVGVLLIWLSVHAAYLNRRLGGLALWMARPPKTGMEGLAVRLQFVLPLGEHMQTREESYPVHVEMICQHEDRRGEDTSTKTLWSHVLLDKLIPQGSRQLDLSVDLPGTLPGAGPLDDPKLEIVWRLVIKALGVEREFHLPVQQGLGEQVDVDALSFWPSAEKSIYALPEVPVNKAGQRRRLFFSYVFFFALIAVGAYFVFGAASGPVEHDKQVAEYAGTSAQAMESIEQLRARLNKGDDVNAVDEEGSSLLIQAADEPNLAKVRLLIEKGANINAATPVGADGNGGRTALFAAINHDAVDIVQALADADADLHKAANQVWTPVHYAAYKGSLKSLRYFQQRGLEMNEGFAGGRGSTPLMLAAQYNQLQVISFLLQSGVDQGKKDLYGEDACGYARYFKQAQAAESLGCH